MDDCRANPLAGLLEEVCDRRVELFWFVVKEHMAALFKEHGSCLRHVFADPRWSLPGKGAVLARHQHQCWNVQNGEKVTPKT
ncbi:hypothetical protein [Scytonema sp. HK-05]|uniref:hypothetical protein n=1 Tax=Scytonema sp. HK-05 TaxID=1137095 RepID=UPI0013010035|nr:hypothetical protein [Scytonema sp. HK-05]